MVGRDIDPIDTVDARGIACPGPLMDLVARIRSASPNEIVVLVSDDDRSRTDVPEWVDETDHELLAVGADGNEYDFYVEVG